MLEKRGSRKPARQGSSPGDDLTGQFSLSDYGTYQAPAAQRDSKWFQTSHLRSRNDVCGVDGIEQDLAGYGAHLALLERLDPVWTLRRCLSCFIMSLKQRLGGLRVHGPYLG